MSTLTKIIKNIDQEITMIQALNTTLSDFILKGEVMDSPKIANALNVLKIVEEDLRGILDDVCRLRGGDLG